MSHLQGYLLNPNVVHDFLVLGFNWGPNHELVIKQRVQPFDRMGTVTELLGVTRNGIVV